MVSHPSSFTLSLLFSLPYFNNQPLCSADSFGKICWENRKDGDMGEDCLVTVDGNDFETDKQGNVKIFWDHKFGNSGLDYEFWFCDFETDKQGNVKIFWDHKFGNSGLDYEFWFCIKTGRLVWIFRPFPVVTGQIILDSIMVRKICWRRMNTWRLMMGTLVKTQAHQSSKRNLISVKQQ